MSKDKAQDPITGGDAADQAKGGAIRTSVKRYTITAPNAAFCGVREGVAFADGTGEGTEAQAVVLSTRGYEVAEIDESPETPPA